MPSGEVCIYRLSDGAPAHAPAGPHEDTATHTGNVRHVEKVELGRGAAEPESDRSFVMGYSAPKMRRKSDNPAPLLDDTRKPDVGFGGTLYTIRVAFYMKSNRYTDMPEALARLYRWLGSTSDIKGTYPNGRYGLRNDGLPLADCEPTREAGYKLEAVEPNWDLKFDDILPVTISLEFGGDASRLNTGFYVQNVGADGFPAADASKRPPLQAAYRRLTATVRPPNSAALGGERVWGG